MIDDKRTLIEEMLHLGMVRIVLDARREGVVVPLSYQDDYSLELNLSHNFAHPMGLEDEAIYAELSFGGRSFFCTIPWGAIYMAGSMVDETKGLAWPQDAPVEAWVFHTAEENAVEPVDETPQASHLRVVK